MANYPNWLGDEQKRIVKLTDNYLRLSTETPVMFNGVLLHCYLDWEKLPQVELSDFLGNASGENRIGRNYRFDFVRIVTES